MDISHDEYDILKIYLCRTLAGTIHNLSIACVYFSQTPHASIYSNLLEKIREMDDCEFERMNRIITLEYYL